MYCSQCGVAVSSEAKFCSACGVQLKSNAAAAADLQDERRQITVMFCDLVDSTRMAELLDPEDMQLVLRAYHRIAGDVIADYRGHVAQHLGDGMLAYFGYPRVNEDDATRAVSAGQKILSQMPRLNEELLSQVPQLSKIGVAVRIGIDTGMVIVGSIGSGGRTENLAAGDTVNIAARLQGCATPGKVVISKETSNLVTGVFELSSIGLQELKGIARPVEAFRVDGEERIQSRFSMASARGLSQFVNREKLLAKLESAWNETTQNNGQSILLVGDAGIGKSRLAQAFRQKLGRHEHGWLECQCASLNSGDALFPIVSLLNEMLGLFNADSLDSNRRRIKERMGLANIHDEKSLRLMYALLGVDDQMDSHGDPELARRATLGVLSEWISALSQERPLVILVEDLHWADPSTLELLGLLLEKTPSTSLMIVLTARKEFVPPWNERLSPGIEPMTPIGKADLRRLIRTVIDDEAAADSAIDALVERSDGIPMFAEELTRAWTRSLSDGAHSLDTIPLTLRDTLAARIDSLGEDRKLLQLASILGRDFSLQLLCELSSQSRSDIENSLQVLVESGVIYENAIGSEIYFRFHHALLQDSAYNSMPKRLRKQRHQEVADFLQARDDEALAAFVAQHYEKADNASLAAQFYLQAGRRESRRAAYFEALGHFRRALELLVQLEKNTTIIALEIDLLLDIALPLGATQGAASAEMGQCLKQVLELCELKGGDTNRIKFQALFGLARHCGAAAKLDQGKKYCTEFISLAKNANNRVYELTATSMLAAMHQWSGQFPQANELSLRVIENAKEFEGKALELKLDVHPVLYAYVVQMWVTWAAGDIEQNRRVHEDALTYARALGNAPAEGYIYAFIVGTLYSFKHYQGALDYAQESTEFCSKRNLVHFLSLVKGAVGGARVNLGDKDGLIDVAESVAVVESMRNGAAIPGYLAMLADCQLLCGKPQDALASINRGIYASESSTAFYYYSFQLHMKAEVLFALEGEDSAEALTLLKKGHKIALEQDCRIMVARIATRLASKWSLNGQKAEAIEILENAVKLFDVEQPCPDLEEAKALLERLV